MTYKEIDGRLYNSNNEELEETFPIEEWDSPEVFKSANIRGYEPMTAKELDTEEAQDFNLNSTDNYIEEKFDGTRALVYFLSQENIKGSAEGYCRVFSRRISKKTGFYVENTDSLPHIKDINVPELAGTILDGEMFINGLPFKEVSSTLNCLWDKAVKRQIEKGFITFHAFDILFYHGIDLRRLPLRRRKVYLHLAIEEANSEYIEEVKYYDCGKVIDVNYLEYMYRIGGGDEDLFLEYLEKNKDTFPNLYKCIEEETNLTPRAYYELIVSTGGEGVIVKPKEGKYNHKRGWEYSKIKKFLTRELIIAGFEEPTREYTGKDIKKWAYWEHNDTGKKCIGNFYGNPEYTPVTKHYYNNQVGVMKLGVLITLEEYNKIPKNKRGEFDFADKWIDKPEFRDKYLMIVCECSGMTDEERDYFTRNRFTALGSVVEVKANEIMKDSGRLRHPRFLRVRNDKEPDRCTWADHIGSSI